MRHVSLAQISVICSMFAVSGACEESHRDDAAEAADGGEAGGGSSAPAAHSGDGDNPAAGSGGKAGTGASGTGGAGQGGSDAAAGQGGRGGPSGPGPRAGRGGSSAGSGGAPVAGGGGSVAAGSGGSRRCGTRGGVTCNGDQFCNHEPDADCGATDRGGVCEAKPQICTAIYAPVCGCDGRTYGSSCEAHGAGVSVKSEGMCSQSGGGGAGGRGGGGAGGKTCGGFAGLMCDGEQFCNYEETAGGQGCDGTIADAAGVCQPTPGACTRDYRPVCSCDRRSFSNRCSANAEGASVLHEGACTEVDCKVLGGRVAYGTGPAAMCERGETEHTWVTDSNGAMPIEGAVCCLP